MKQHMDDLLLEMQRALWGAVIPALRAVAIDVNENENAFDFWFFYDGEIDDERFDLASVAVTEIDEGTFSHAHREHILQWEHSKSIPMHGNLAYLRKEPTQFLPKKEDRTYLLNDLRDKKIIPIAILGLDMQEALLGKVTPALREVDIAIDMQQKKMQFDFIYDGEISKEDFDLASSVVTEGNWTFSDFQIDSRITRLDFPQWVDREGKRIAYLRKEDMPD